MWKGRITIIAQKNLKENSPKTGKKLQFPISQDYISVRFLTTNLFTEMKLRSVY